MFFDDVLILRNLFFVTPLFYSIGNAAEEIQWACAYASSNNKKLVIVKPYKFTEILSYKICNAPLFHVADNQSFTWSEASFIILVRFTINLIFLIKRSAALFVKIILKRKIKESWNFPEFGKDMYWPLDFSNVRSGQISVQIKKVCLNHIALLPTIRAQETLTEIGLPVGQKYVCLHVRDAGFHGDGERRPYRNADIENYQALIKELIAEGFYVVRMGDSNMKRLTILNQPKYIEYPFTNVKSEVVDLYLIKNCEFYVGMQSGILDVAALFRKPILTVNMYDWFYQHPLKKIDRGLTKTFQLKIENKKINLQVPDLYKLPFYYTNNRNIYTKNDIEFIENTPDELLNAIKEYVKDYKSNFTRLPTRLQQIYFEKYRQSSDEIISLESMEGEFSKLPSQHKSRIVHRNFASVGFMYGTVDERFPEVAVK